MAMPNLLDIAKRNASDLSIELIDEALLFAPEVRLGPARPIPGRQYRTLVRTSNPTVSFRDANEGVAVTKAGYENRLFETFIFNPQWECDKAVAESSIDGADAFIADEAQAMVNAATLLLGRVFYYGTGTGGDAKGFPGLLQAYDSTNMVVDAGGTTDDTATSLWAVCWGPGNVRWVWGNNGSLNMSELSEARLIDGSSNPYTAFRQEILAYAGLQVGHVKCVGRIKKITEDSSKTLTDAMIYALLAKFPAVLEPDVLFCTVRSLEQLRASRTATTPTGAPAPYPTSIQGVKKQIPIVVTETILNTEKLAL